MSKRKPGETPPPADLTVEYSTRPKMKWIGGSDSDNFNTIVINEALKALWRAHDTEETKSNRYKAAISAMAAIRPKDETEGMLAAQMVACHAAAMECYRRAMIEEQTHEGRQQNLNFANKT